MNNPINVLLVEDDPGAAEGLRLVMAGDQMTVEVAGRGDVGLERAKKSDFHVVVTDLKLPGLSGLELVRQLHTAKPRVPIILITAHGTTEIAIEATKLGAYDYLLKPFEIEEFLDLVHQAAESGRLISDPIQLGESPAGTNAIVGHSRPMQDIYKEIGRVAARPVTVLIRGETGTGKELITRALYQHSDRAEKPFIAVNCAAIPETLLESELFGHERGAFTGAEARRIGRFEQAHEGTLFLDEIGELPPGTQAKLLRVLQERKFQRLGGKEDILADVRLLAATNRDLEKAIEKGEFREDLYYRLNAVVLHLPPLRERREDIPDLVRYLLRRYAEEFRLEAPSIQPEAIQYLQQQPWPGNVRELENVIRKSLLEARGLTITTSILRQILTSRSQAPTEKAASLAGYVKDLLDRADNGELDEIHNRLITAAEKELLSQAIRRAQGNQAKVARWLGLSRLTTREKLLQFGLHPSQTSAEKSGED